MVLIDKVMPPLNNIALLGSNPLRVYVVLFEAAQHDVRDNCGGTSCWTIKGIANQLVIQRKTVARALDKLLDTGYLQIAGEQKNGDGCHSSIWRVTHPAMLEAVRYSIELMGKPSERLRRMRAKQQKIDTTKYYEGVDFTDF